MGIYRSFLAPRLVDLACGSPAMASWRVRCVEDLEGSVVEVGFGAGRNLPLYPATVTSLVAVEPSPVMRLRAQPRLAQSPIPFTWGGLDGQKIDLPDDSCDAAVVTFSLCTIADPRLALRELRRVVRPGGELRVLEHGRAPDDRVLRWQRRLDGFERRVADGCSLINDPVACVQDSGWILTSTYQRYVRGPKPWCYFSSLRAH
jgi:ubiquinone/menaquinone biosynthesis C-methylase UbiE